MRRRGTAVITTVRGHQPIVRTVAAGLTVLQGFESWGKRAYDTSTMGTYRRAIRAAEAAGDRQGLAEWLDRKECAAPMRHKRLMDAPKLAFGVVEARTTPTPWYGSSRTTHSSRTAPDQGKRGWYG